MPRLFSNITDWCSVSPPIYSATGKRHWTSHRRFSSVSSEPCIVFVPSHLSVRGFFESSSIKSGTVSAGGGGSRAPIRCRSISTSGNTARWCWAPTHSLRTAN